MNHKRIVIIVIILVALAPISLAIPVKAADWQLVTTITGAESQTTSEFMVNGSDWRVRWSYIPDAQFPDLTIFSFFVYRHGEAANYVGRVYQSGAEQTSGVLTLSGETGLHRIEILVGNTRGYTLNVEYNTESVVSDFFLVLVVGLALGIPIVLIIVMSVLVRRRVKKRKLEMAQFPFPPPPPP